MSKETFADVRKSVKDSMSSIFTREDVLRIVDRLEGVSSERPDISDLKNAVDEVLLCISAVNDIDTSELTPVLARLPCRALADIEDIELSISGREVCVDSVEIVGLDHAMIDLRQACSDLEDLCNKI